MRTFLFLIVLLLNFYNTFLMFGLVHHVALFSQFGSNPPKFHNFLSCVHLSVVLLSPGIFIIILFSVILGDVLTQQLMSNSTLLLAHGLE